MLPWAIRSLTYGLGLPHAGGGPADYRTQYSNTPHSHNSATTDVETGSKLIKQRGGETLHEGVGELRCRRDMEDANLTDGNLLSDEMKINLHMLRALMLNGVGGEVHDTDVITVDESATRWRSLELMQELAQPGSLSHTIDDGMILGFGAGAGDDNLPLGRPGDQVVPEEHGIARHGVTSVRTASPVSVSVDDQVGARQVV
jgi:CBS domain-containing protein